MLEDLLIHTISCLDKNASKDSSGGPTHPSRSQLFTAVPARITAKQSSQITALGELVIKTVYDVYTQQPGIVNGQILVANDGETTRTLRVEGVPKFAAQGSIDSFYRISCVESSGGKG